jgi:TolB-like protein
MEKDRESRYQSAEELYDRLSNLEKGLPAKEKVVPRKKPLTSREITVTVGLKRLFIPLLAIGALVIIAIVIWRLVPKREIVSTKPDKPFIAVLPFADLSPLKDQEHFCDGIAAEIIADFSVLHNLQVIPRSSSMNLRGTKKNIKEQAKALNIRFLVDGSVRKIGDDLRITAELIDAINDVNLWADTYPGKTDDVFEIQEKVSRSIVEALKVEVSPEEQQKFIERPIHDIQAYDYYLKARWEYSKKTKNGLDRALQYLQHALDIIGDNAQVYAYIAYIYWGYVNLGFEQEDYIEKAEEWARKALDIDPNSASACVVIGKIYQAFKGNQSESIKYFKRALVINPNDLDALVGILVGYACYTGKMSKAAPILKRILQLDPLNPGNHRRQAMYNYYGGKHDLFLTHARMAYDQDPDNPFVQFYLANAYAFNNDYEEVYSLVDKTVKFPPQDLLRRINLLLKYGLQDNREKALELLTPDFINTCERDGTWSVDLAIKMALLNEKEKALDWLENAVNRDFINYPLLNEYVPFFENLRSDPRFKRLMEKVKHKWENFDV